MLTHGFYWMLEKGILCLFYIKFNLYTFRKKQKYLFYVLKQKSYGLSKTTPNSPKKPYPFSLLPRLKNLDKTAFKLKNLEFYFFGTN